MSQSKQLLRMSFLVFLLLIVSIILFFLTKTSWFNQYDVVILRKLVVFRTSAGLSFFKWLSYIGSAHVLPFVLVGFTIILLIIKKPKVMVIWLACFLLQKYINSLIKNSVQRPRPILHHYELATGYSFPSGHAMNAITVYGLLALILVLLIKSRLLRILVLFIGFLIVILIGLSRLVLDVHYLSDVIAGYCIGGILVSISMYLIISKELIQTNTNKE
ncbi:phosphatase PAP2 family protein [Terrilactibacillus laevilacticus]|uniref:Phosphatase PAP2 family protein n=1 Tax=Terrilactibacillus laevilacticus TaxID=1380157 RepID=A0ABW5PQJ4_9BACI|nr:phosphatase PAP2 family protein [Terrilactibacillus laevilacticus]